MKSYEKMQLVELHSLFKNKWSKILKLGNFESTTNEAKLRDWICAHHPSRYKESFTRNYYATKTCVCCGEREEIENQLHVCKPAKSGKNKDLGAYLHLGMQFCAFVTNIDIIIFSILSLEL